MTPASTHGPRPFFPRLAADPLLAVIAAGFLAAAAALAFFLEDPTARLAALTLMGQAVTAVAAVLFWWPASDDPAERRLFRGIGLSWTLWFVRYLVAAAGLSGSGGLGDPGIWISFASYLIFVIAAESGPERPRQKGERRAEWGRTWPAAALFTVGLVTYFVWIPAASAESAAGFLPFMGFEIYLAVRFTQLALWAPSTRWRILYGLLALSDAGFAVSDFFAGPLMTGAVSLTGHVGDVVWLLPFLPATLVARLRHADLPREVRADDPGPEPLIAPREQLVPVLVVLPLLHVVGYAAELLDPSARHSRDLLAAGWLLAMGGLAAVQFRRLSVQARRLAVDAALAAREAEEKGERLRLENRLMRAQRLESLGVLAGGVAHDLNNLLAPILGAVGALRGEAGASGGGSDRLLETIESNARHGSDLTGQLLSFARGSGGEPTSVPVSRMMEEVERLVRATFPESIEVRFEPDHGEAVVRGEPAQLRQVLLNLCLNARDAMEDVGLLSVRSELVPGSPGGPARVVLRVADTGPGITPEVRERLFEPFFTTKASERGLGLGLAVARSIVSGHGGTLEVESPNGRGAEFRIELPAALDRPEPDAAEPSPSPPAGAGELILVVDDERVLRDFTSGVLEASGYRALVAADGASALELLDRRRDEVRAAVVDRVMPGLDGAATVRELHRVRPNLPILLVSGLVDADAPVPDGVVGVLRKPFEIDELLGSLARAIDAREGAGAGAVDGGGSSATRRSADR